MKIYLINQTTGEIVREFTDVISWVADYVIFSQNGNIGKIYATDDEQFTDNVGGLT